MLHRNMKAAGPSSVRRICHLCKINHIACRNKNTLHARPETDFPLLGHASTNLCGCICWFIILNKSYLDRAHRIRNSRLPTSMDITCILPALISRSHEPVAAQQNIRGLKPSRSMLLSSSSTKRLKWVLASAKSPGHGIPVPLRKSVMSDSKLDV